MVEKQPQQRGGRKKGTPTKSGSSAKPDPAAPNPYVLGRYVPKINLPPHLTSLLNEDKPRPGSLAEIVRLAEYAETFCRTYESEVVSHTRLHGPKTHQSAYSQSGAAAGIGGFVTPLLHTINPSN